jgi:anthranilate/para-aminobenzoate synthase component I
MTSDPNTTPDSAIEITHTNDLVETELADQSDEVKQETKALIDALKLRAQSEVRSAEDLAKSASDYTRETYLKLVRQARESVEQGKLFDLERIEQSAQQLQQEAEKNWQSLVHEVNGFSDRLSEAAKLAWDKLTEPHDKS